jgi:hypothetical protein
LGLRETQALLARLFTDAKLRHAFFEDPRGAAHGLGLSEDEAKTLAALDKREVEEFARCLLGKRALDARKVLPLTAKALGENFDRLLFEACDGPPSPARHRGDAAALARLLEGRKGEPAWIGDLARFEMAFVTAARPGVFLRRFDWPISDIARQLLAGAHVDTGPRRRFGIWLRAPGGKLYWRMVQAPRRKA